MTPRDPGTTDARRPALENALRCLARRPLTEHELRDRLDRRGHAASEVEDVLARLRDDGYVDDLRLALDFIQTRSERLGHGRGRLFRDLRRRGVDEVVLQRAWSQAIDERRIDPEGQLRARIRSRVERAGGRLGPADFRRVYNALLRAGFDAEQVAAELRPHCRTSDLDR